MSERARARERERERVRERETLKCLRRCCRHTRLVSTQSRLRVSSYAIYKSCLKWQSSFRMICRKKKEREKKEGKKKTKAPVPLERLCSNSCLCPNAAFTLDLLVGVQIPRCLSSLFWPWYDFFVVLVWDLEDFISSGCNYWMEQQGKKKKKKKMARQVNQSFRLLPKNKSISR